jgi:hypothetical protein
VRIYNFQDDNFFLPHPEQATRRFTELRDALRSEGVTGIAIAVKARPDSINREAIRVLDDLGLFRVFLGVENASEEGLRHLNRKCTRDQIENALGILNDFDVHIAYNLLMFEPDATMEDLFTNLRFIERHMDNPFNFCRAEAYACTGLETKLREDGILLGDYFGFDYRIKNPRVEVFHRIANHAFFDRNFSDFGLHYFNMEVDFSFQLLRRFYPEILTQSLRGDVRSFIKETNIDTYRCLCQIYDIAAAIDPADEAAVKSAMRRMRLRVDEGGADLRACGERILKRLHHAYAERETGATASTSWEDVGLPFGALLLPHSALKQPGAATETDEWASIFGMLETPIPYEEFRKQLAAAR